MKKNNSKKCVFDYFSLLLGLPVWAFEENKVRLGLSGCHVG
jgi:hypothetical protein